ncbi:MAG: hypothetical protein BGP11_16030 [Rhodobacterales bacterium 65-51]|mgnify:CR=1 FL=1|uniref:hypothetical protein n=1 Tax=uncultured Gemmobacter sp. TaxID=1095917 RepID=UPI0009654D70|nr:hypothetical protein [uncultured Gemmobacter sp.]OJY35783.1 MAG: hypothetical protein BGP11_16030 [Rhodobacterales bacterium 65-51]
MLGTFSAPEQRFHVERIGGRLRVISPEGKLVGPPFESRRAAVEAAQAMQAEADRHAKRGPRPCMCCGRNFDSEGIHNRLCAHCRNRGDAASLSIPTNSIAKIRRAAS